MKKLLLLATTFIACATVVEVSANDNAFTSLDVVEQHLANLSESNSRLQKSREQAQLTQQSIIKNNVKLHTLIDNADCNIKVAEIALEEQKVSRLSQELKFITDAVEECDTCKGLLPMKDKALQRVEKSMNELTKLKSSKNSVCKD